LKKIQKTETKTSGADSNCVMVPPNICTAPVRTYLAIVYWTLQTIFIP